MLILSLDSAGDGCAACVWQDGGVLALQRETMGRGQDGRFVPLILEVMQTAGKTFDALDRVAVTRGPGSFTGLRVGLATARGIGLGTSKPVLGIDRFSIIERQIAYRPLLAIIDSRRQELFCQFMANGTRNEPVLLDVAQIMACFDNEPTLRGAGFLLDGLGGRFLALSEDETVTAAALVAEADCADERFLPRPLYLRPPDVTLCKKS